MSIRNAAEGIIKLLIKKYDIPVEVKVSEHFGQRFKTCQECTPKAFCPECGCIKEAKALIELEKCPLGKWNDNNIVQA